MIQDPSTLSLENTNPFCQALNSAYVSKTPRISDTWKEVCIDVGYECMKQNLETFSKQMAAAHISPPELQRVPASLQMPERPVMQDGSTLWT